MELKAYATIFGKMVNVYSDNSFGELTDQNVQLKHKNKIGQWVNLDSRYFNNLTEIETV